MTPERVKWEPSKGLSYAVLFNRMLEIYNIESDKDGQASHSITFDSNQTSFDFLSPKEILVSDEKGRVTLLSSIDKQDSIEMKIALTGLKRIKKVETSPDFNFFVTLTSESVAIWNTKEFMSDLAENETDLMVELEPQKVIKRTQRLTACSITIIKEIGHK